MTIYFVTNRNPNTKLNNYFGRFNDDGQSVLRFGKATVKGNKITVTTAKEKLIPTKDKRKLDLQKSKLGSREVFDDIRKTMMKECKDTIVYIHGYSVAFKEALKTGDTLRQQFQSVNGGKGVNVIVFSWPSNGRKFPFLSYYSDRRDAEASGPALGRSVLTFYDFLDSLNRRDYCQQRVHLMCHSMGNYVLRHGLKEYLRQNKYTVQLFDQVFLMAADEDNDAFEYAHKLENLPSICKQVNVYTNRGDLAMRVSDHTKFNPQRLGETGPLRPFNIPSNVAVIDCSKVVTKTLSEHAYFKNSKAVINDLTRVLNGELPHELAGRDFVKPLNRYHLA